MQLADERGSLTVYLLQLPINYCHLTCFISFLFENPCFVVYLQMRRPEASG